MCQAIPRPVLEVTAEQARVLVDGQELWVDARAVPGLNVGDYVVVYAGTALEIVPENEALALLELYAEIERSLVEDGGLPLGADTLSLPDRPLAPVTPDTQEAHS